tara:strand:- start:1102 stop:1332 length:231 start_codon:yes stop_codon:yes gene_type:complete
MDGCNHCEKVKQLMQLTKQRHVVYTLDDHFTIEEFNSEFDTYQFPQVVADLPKGKRLHIGGASEVAVYFRENNLAS